jgi:beta-lactamase class A
MYLGSAVKLLFMVEVFRQREAEELRFDDKIRYRREDVRDGAPAMNKLRRGLRYPIEELLTYMLRDSDNAAADMIAARVGLDNVQAGLAEDGFERVGPLVNMMDVRREVYSRLDPRAVDLDAVEIRDVRWRDHHNPRLDILRKHIGKPYGDYDEADLDAAYDDYYRLGRNHVPMRTMGRVMERLIARELISADASEEMIARLKAVWSSGNRVRGAVPDDIVVAHKTGTQRRRISDVAIVYLRDGTPLVMALAVENLGNDEAEEVLRAIAGRAFELSSALAEEKLDDERPAWEPDKARLGMEPPRN